MRGSSLFEAPKVHSSVSSSFLITIARAINLHLDASGTWAGECDSLCHHLINLAYLVFLFRKLGQIRSFLLTLTLKNRLRYMVEYVWLSKLSFISYLLGLVRNDSSRKSHLMVGTLHLISAIVIGLHSSLPPTLKIKKYELWHCRNSSTCDM